MNHHTTPLQPLQPRALRPAVLAPQPATAVAPGHQRRPAAALLCLLSLAAAAWAAPAGTQSLLIQPGPQVLAGEPVQIRLQGLPPAAEVTLRASRVVRQFSGGTRLFVAQARYQADAQGQVDLATQAPLSGSGPAASSYSGVDPRGLFWSMTATNGPTDGLPMNQVQIDAELAGKPLARQTLQLLPQLPEVAQRPAPPLAGAQFAVLPGAVRRPALILLGGSEGGSQITRDAPVWASRGYAVLALPYYSPGGWSASGPTPPELPSLPASFTDIPLERLEEARSWLAAQQEVDASRIGVMGTSKGAEFALLAASRMPWIRSVVAIVPSDVVWEGWGDGIAPGTRSSFAWKGQPLPFVPYEGFAKEFQGFATNSPVLIRRPHDQGRAAHPGRVAAARIPVADIAAPLLVAGGHDDQIWASGSMAEAIAATRRAAGLDTVALVYPDAGHYLGGTGYGPTTHYNDGPMKSGGQPAATARAQAEVFQQTQAFLARTLGPLPR